MEHSEFSLLPFVMLSKHFESVDIPCFPLYPSLSLSLPPSFSLRSLREINNATNRRNQSMAKKLDRVNHEATPKRSTRHAGLINEPPFVCTPSHADKSMRTPSPSS